MFWQETWRYLKENRIPGEQAGEANVGNTGKKCFSIQIGLHYTSVLDYTVYNVILDIKDCYI